MRKQERAKIILHRLEKLYPITPIPLNHNSKFELLVAVVLSAQSTDKKVNEVTSNLFNAASSPKDMVKLGINKIYLYINKLGLANNKAKNIYNLSKIIIEEFNNEIPNTFESLESLPGVGHKTASVVMAQGFKVPAFPVDTHIHRLSQRWKLTSGKNVIQTEKDLKKLFPKSKWNKLHLQIIFYGREHCTARGCDGTVCIICRELFPTRKKGIVCIKP